MSTAQAITEHGSYPRRRPRLRATGSDGVTPIDIATRKQPISVTAPVSADYDTMFDEARTAAPQRLLTQPELYPVRKAFSPEHITALRLLRLGIRRSQRAIQYLAEGDQLGADTEIQKVQVLLPELFCCRSLGDGFGTTVNALLSAFEALNGTTPNRDQVCAINNLLALLWDKPFLTADEADQHLAELENVGLTSYPEELLSFLSSE